jgi:hypothetical protein
MIAAQERLTVEMNLSMRFASIHLRSTSGEFRLRKTGVQQNKDIPE